ncbi:CAP domain-containing protein [Chitinophaga silvatica]|uniref:CAP domain-containing protein n=1 Tax=Chitinophaga silvatica TaxID=2282649 RepID=UPI0018F1C51C|nr:CAP domain-containing protein [Chitinophaga silvatica]
MSTRLISLFLCLIISMLSRAQGWKQKQLDSAATAANIAYLSQTEKDAIMYINLCRLFPKDFEHIELSQYETDPAYEASYLKMFAEYKKSLQQDLLKRVAVAALVFDEVLYKDAKCYSTEISKADRKPHERKDCPPSNYAECLSYGQSTGQDIAMQLLIDAGVTSLGHRINCLNKEYHKIGLSAGEHFEWKYCAVAEFIW